MRFRDIVPFNVIDRICVLWHRNPVGRIGIVTELKWSDFTQDALKILGIQSDMFAKMSCASVAHHLSALSKSETRSTEDSQPSPQSQF